MYILIYIRFGVHCSTYSDCQAPFGVSLYTGGWGAGFPEPFVAAIKGIKLNGFDQALH